MASKNAAAIRESLPTPDLCNREHVMEWAYQLPTPERTSA